MTDTLKPRDAKDVEDAVQWALAQSKALEIVGGGSKRAIGRPAQTDLTLDLSGLSGVTLYEPEELVLSARAGTPLAEVEALIAAKDQMLAFDPMDYGPLLGGPSGRATIGGVLAANLSGPRRLKAGAARDHFLGFSAVSGRGEIFKSGGRVVKNVTGYDLCKVMAGSWGTLAALAEVTIKVLPRPETEETVTVLGLDDRTAVTALSAAMGSAAEVSGAAHLPGKVAQQALAGADGTRAVTALRLEGVPASIAHRRRVLEAVLKPFGTIAVLEAQQSRALWLKVRDVTPFASGGTADTPVWRISTAPAKGAELGGMIAGAADAALLYDWAGGLVWAALPASDDAGASLVRRAVAACGGHATLIRAPTAVRAAVAVFEPQEPALAALSKRVKESFDPNGVLNPGRMWAGI
ncbi:MAG: glycolate oxidase subunit GlcE [Xanthobacteraceae bacterium]|jgi:glycolate oxidase FAD binding subunit